eukprot:8155795-Pyramimonas_sp.AAC.1
MGGGGVRGSVIGLRAWVRALAASCNRAARETAWPLARGQRRLCFHRAIWRLIGVLAPPRRAGR